ncbi:MAG TPA: DeoR/GlpR family DNA-binding transcription regulator [Jatrophihabitans sp.]|nr:DeoR/GlpR family DNA-binding transcription regulator [Jatrophihabitans sp.]
MLRHERLNAVLDLLVARGSLSVEDIADVFGVSASTVRRDLDDLASQQLIARTRGGAAAHVVTYDLPLRYKSVRHPDEKRRIAAAAAAHVPPGAIVGINGGTTTTEVARAIAAGASGVDGGITVVTNALNIANELTVRPSIKIVVVGGVVRPRSFELVGPLANRLLDDLSLDVMFLGVDGLSPDDGAAAAHEGEAEINRTMVMRARRVVAVADSSKLGARAFCKICDVSALDLLITDGGADPDLVSRFEQLGVEVQIG